MNDESDGGDLRSLKNDLAFVRAIADDDGRGMARDGALLALVGVVFGLTTLQYFLIFANLLVVSGGVRPWLWLDGVVVFFLGLMLVRRRLPRRAGLAARAMDATWSGVGVSITVAGAALGIAGHRTGIPTLATTAFPIALFVIYGTAWAVAFAIRKRTWLMLVAGGCFAAALACAWLAGTAAEWLVLSAGLFLLVAVPGAAIMRLAREH